MAIRVDPEGTETRVIHDLVDFQGKHVLEIGCGDGRMTRRFADTTASVVAIDADETRIAAARESTPPDLRSKISFQVGDITNFEPPENTYDVAVFARSL